MALGKLLWILPSFDKHEDARPRVGPDLGVIEAPYARAVMFLFVVRPTIGFSNSIAPDSGGNDIGVTHEIHVVQITCRDQVLQGQVSKVTVIAFEFRQINLRQRMSH
jgi:hypothetical protein